MLLTTLLYCATVPATGPLPQDAYVWQQAWTPAVQEAVDTHPFRDLVVLGGTLDWEEGLQLFERPALPPESALALRVEVPPPGKDPLPALQHALAKLALAYPQAPYLQLDLDLPTRRLGEYTQWIEALKQAGLPPLRITALPTWMDDPAFGDLAHAAPHYVLQLHWFDPKDPTRLLDPEALAHIEQAADLGVPFSAALPSYSYTLLFDADSQRVAITAEQGRVAPIGASAKPLRAEQLRADPAAVAQVVAALNQAHPTELEALVWFRLPTSQDHNSWSMETLTLVAAGDTPAAQAEFQVQATGEQIWQIRLLNSGTDTLTLPELHWQQTPTFWDALGSYHRETGHLNAEGSLAPGESQVVAWARFPTAPTLLVSH